MPIVFRKLLVRAGKLLPFLLSLIMSVSYIENAYAIGCKIYTKDANGDVIYNTPISYFLAELIYIDFLDIMLLYILAFALEFCKYNLRAINVLTVCVLSRSILECYVFDDSALMIICLALSALCLFAIYGGFKMLPRTKNISHN